MIRHFIVSAVKLKNTEFDSILSSSTINIKFGILWFGIFYYQQLNLEMPNLLVSAVINIKFFFILKTAYPIQFNNKYKIRHFVIWHFIVSAVKFKNAENDTSLSARGRSVLPSVANLCTSWFGKLSFDIFNLTADT